MIAEKGLLRWLQMLFTTIDCYFRSENGWNSNHFVHQKGNVLIKQFRVDLSIHNTQKTLLPDIETKKSHFTTTSDPSVCYLWTIRTMTGQKILPCMYGAINTNLLRDPKRRKNDNKTKRHNSPQFHHRSDGALPAKIHMEITRSHYMPCAVQVPSAQLRMRDSRIKSLVRRL